MLEQLALDWAILGVDELDPVAGATARREGKAGINYLMAARAAQVMIVTDSSKLGKRAFARVCARTRSTSSSPTRTPRRTSLAAFPERGIRVVAA